MALPWTGRSRKMQFQHAAHLVLNAPMSLAPTVLVNIAQQQVNVADKGDS